MGILKFLKKLEWKYIIREVLLIFIGINLAIWFNNWNTNKKSKNDKTVIISKIKDEIRNNSKSLDTARILNQKILSAYEDFKKVYHESSSEIITSPKKLAELQKQYPRFFRVKDSVKIDTSNYHYEGETFIVLEIPDITSIAWETIRTINIANEFDYDCLYELESLYDLQDRVKNEIDKAAEALQKGDVMNLFKILKFVDQLNSQLEANYKKILAEIDNCD